MDTEGQARSSLTPARLGEILGALGSRIEDTDQVVELLQRAVDLAHDIIPGADSCGVTIDFDGATYTATYTDELTLTVDRHQYEAGEGPCLHASRTGESVVVNCTEQDERWPEFTDAARAEGVLSVLASPIRTLDGVIGSFNLYGLAERAFDDLDTDVLEGITTTVGRAIGEHARYSDATSAVRGLREAMEQRAPIEQARGIMMAMDGVDAEAAFATLTAEAQRRGMRVRDVAAEFVRSTSARDHSAE
ncbi:GAF and ANTAR domain-containing protein [Rhodococcoides corynebacterioides]|uniref:GAF and ANTAR domain-containing protein n=1 Tax=Rhodococcoides corynebacterioides TaxID=53972 RepID=A0ABS7P4C6_9NOCA|nr:GAF and ANTAR domain-containing protein [Rhodococcus corynebacterioides]MBY6367279.1 GAF and ANTAR domain-containing protein [Rhodococcus corynebacterioides]MBY6408822.1 GAF and ANTAR domain-containing protein [Rhodococcus corynebacterioides]